MEAHEMGSRRIEILEMESERMDVCEMKRG